MNLIKPVKRRVQIINWKTHRIKGVEERHHLRRCELVEEHNVPAVNVGQVQNPKDQGKRGIGGRCDWNRKPHDNRHRHSKNCDHDSAANKRVYLELL
jgi:hypothetical protein